MLWCPPSRSGWRLATAGANRSQKSTRLSVFSSASVWLVYVGAFRLSGGVRCCRRVWSLRPMCYRRLWARTRHVCPSCSLRRIVAVAAVPLVAVIAATASAVLLLPPVSLTEVRERGDPALSAEFYAPLLDQLAARGEDGPIEVVPSLRRGEAAFVAPVVATARGWSRQIDIGRNPIFYDGTLSADTYRGWLDDNAISYVAISNGPYEWAATDEAALVRRGLPYLQAVWSDRTWTLYAVTNPRPVISSPGRVIARDPVSLTVAVPEPGEYVVRVRWSRYLSASNGCMRPTEDGWSVLVVEQSGTVTIEGSLAPRHC